MSKMHAWTNAEKRFLASIIDGTSYKDAALLLNEKFGLHLSVQAVGAAIKRFGLVNNRKTTFARGHAPFNKNLKGIRVSPETEFKKGHKPYNYKPVGSERINTYGYMDVKIANPNIWKGKHILVWEKANGKVPRGHVVIFADGNKMNLDLDNLILVSRKQLVVMNKHKLITSGNAAGTKTGVIIADIKSKISECKKRL